MDVARPLWWLSMATELGALIALALRGLWPSYTWFMSYLGFGAVRGLILNFIGNSTQTSYGIAWLITTPIALLLLVMATREIVRKIPAHYPAFGRFGEDKLRWLLKAAVAFAVLNSVIEAAGPYWRWSNATWLPFMLGLSRITTLTMAVYLVLVTIFVSRVQVPFRRNLVIHAILFGLYLWFQTATMLWAVIIGHGTPEMNQFLTAGTAGIFVLWAVLLTRAGEALPDRRTLSAAAIAENEKRERALHDAARRYSERPLG